MSFGLYSWGLSLHACKRLKQVRRQGMLFPCTLPGVWVVKTWGGAAVAPPLGGVEEAVLGIFFPDDCAHLGVRHKGVLGKQRH